MTLQEHARNLLDNIPVRIKRHAQDYLTGDRLHRRLRMGEHTVAAELIGYRDTYHMALATTVQPELSCSCTLPTQPCAHAVALVLDLDQHFQDYTEANWKSSLKAKDALSRWPFDEGLHWSFIDKARPWWRHAHQAERIATLQNLALRPTVGPGIAKDPSLAIWAELDPSWLSDPAVMDAFRSWLAVRSPVVPQEWSLWVLLHWMQPLLPLSAIFLSADPPSLPAQALLAQMYHPAPLIRPTAQRRVRLLEDLTLVDPDLANPLWTLSDGLDPYHLVQADALFLANQKKKAIGLLERHLPTDKDARRQARRRLVQWTGPEDSMAHQLAMAWESGLIEDLTSIQHLMSPQAWDRAARAIQTDPNAWSTDDQT